MTLPSTVFARRPSSRQSTVGCGAPYGRWQTTPSPVSFQVLKHPKQQSSQPVSSDQAFPCGNPTVRKELMSFTRVRVPELTDPHTHLRSRTWLAMTPGCADFPSGRSYRNSLQSQTTAYARCHPFLTPLGLGTCRPMTTTPHQAPGLLEAAHFAVAAKAQHGQLMRPTATLLPSTRCLWP